MNERENLIAMLSGQKPDFIPHFNMGFNNEKAIHTLLSSDCYDERTFYIPSDHPPMEAFPRRPRSSSSRLKAVNFAKTLLTPCIGVGDGGVTPFGHGGPAEIQPRVIERSDSYKVLQYEGGHKRKILYDPVSIQYFSFPLKEQSDLQELVLPDMSDDLRYRDVREDAKFFKKEGFIPTASIQGFFSGIHNSFMSMEDTMINLLLEPDFIHAVTNRLVSMNMEAVEQVMERGVEIINICDDLGNRDGLLISPQLFETFFLPHYRTLCSAVHEKGGWVHFHSHGNIEEMMPLFLNAGFDMINPFDLQEVPQVLDLMKKYGDRIIFAGGIDSSFLYWHPDHQFEHLNYWLPRYTEACERGYALMTSNLSADLGKEKFGQTMKLISDMTNR